jgi:hypothetical protein
VTHGTDLLAPAGTVALAVAFDEGSTTSPSPALKDASARQPQCCNRRRSSANRLPVLIAIWIVFIAVCLFALSVNVSRSQETFVRRRIFSTFCNLKYALQFLVRLPLGSPLRHSQMSLISQDKWRTAS